MTQLTREQVLELFHQRSSTRYYDPTKKISDEDFECILECGRLSPSSVGSEPWKFLVIQNKTLREKMKPFSWGMINQLDNCSHLVVILAKKNARYDSPFFVDVMARKGLNAEQQQAALAKYKTLQEEDMKLLATALYLIGAVNKLISPLQICLLELQPLASTLAQLKVFITTK